MCISRPFSDLRKRAAAAVPPGHRGCCCCRSEAARGTNDVEPRGGRGRGMEGRVGFCRSRSSSRRVDRDVANLATAVPVGHRNARGVALAVGWGRDRASTVTTTCGFCRLPAVSGWVQTASDELTYVARVEEAGPRSAGRHGREGCR